MLGRTANDLFWMARSMERAENMARLLEVGYRLTLLPHDGGDAEWRSTLRSRSGCEAATWRGTSRSAPPAWWISCCWTRTTRLPSLSCLSSARRNARAQRTACTREMWESLNSAWMEFPNHASSCIEANELPPLFDWIRERSALFRGALLNTILRNDTFYFAQLGTFVERADNTARILDVKYYVLLPENELVGGGVDSAQWAAILRSVSAHRSFRWVYRDAFKPWHIADFLMLNPQMPRSLRSSYGEIVGGAGRARRAAIRRPGQLPGARRRHPPRRLAEGDMNRILQSGLHEFLRDFIVSNNRLASDIAADYYFNV